MVEEFVDVTLGALEPQQFAHAARPKHVVPHEAGVVQRGKPHKTSIARKSFEGWNHRVTTAEQVNQTLAAQSVSTLVGDLVEYLVLTIGEPLQNGDQAFSVCRARFHFLPFVFLFGVLKDDGKLVSIPSQNAGCVFEGSTLFESDSRHHEGVATLSDTQERGLASRDTSDFEYLDCSERSQPKVPLEDFVERDVVLHQPVESGAAIGQNERSLDADRTVIRSAQSAQMPEHCPRLNYHLLGHSVGCRDHVHTEHA